MSVHMTDRGLRAVRRVREARERDSRIGLQQALSAARRREGEAEALRARLHAEPEFVSGSAGEYLAHTVLVRGLAEAVAAKDEEVRRSSSVAEEARRRWALDRQAVRTVELLLDRRAEERRREHARRDAAGLDELAAQGWLRVRAAGASSAQEVSR